MSASNKKKLRREQEAAKLTEKQLAAQKEAKKTNAMTAAFVVVMAAILVIALVVGVTQTISANGIREKSTTALTLGDHDLNSVEMNYFYMDSVNNFYSQYGSYAAMFGLDVTKPLNEQIVDESTGLTWADDFYNSAKSDAAAVYAMADAAAAAGYTLPEDEAKAVEDELASLDLYATMYGYSNADQYLKAFYGNGASEKSFLEYNKLRALANSYYNSYADSLTYDEAAISAAEAEDPMAYNAYSYNSYYLSTARFQEGGTTNEDGTTTYSDEEKAAAAEAAKAAAESLLDVKSVAELDEAIAALSINEGTAAASTVYDNTAYASVNSAFAEWVTSADRKAGDVDMFPYNTTTTAEDGTETTSLNGYYVVFFNGASDNAFAMKNVRHILVSFEHDHSESEEHDHSTSSYTDEEKAAAKTAAEEILAEFEAGSKTEESFATLANLKSDDGDGTSGGLYENVYPGQMVENFENWCYDDSRKTGDTGIVETEYGYHVMYFVGNTEQTYREFQIENTLRSADLESWYTENLDAMTQTDGDTTYLNMDLVLNVNG